MARINFDESVYKDQGYQDLLCHVGNRFTARGMTLELFTLAQEYWVPARRCIPLERFRAAGLPDLLFAPGGLAELRGEEVYVRGSAEAFEWLFAKSEAGKKSAEVRKSKSGSAQPSKPKPKKPRKFPEHSSKSVREPLEQAPNSAEHQPTSLLSSPYSSLSSPFSELSPPTSFLDCDGLPTEAHAQPLGGVSPTSAVWRAYKAAYAARYGAEPTWNGKVAGQIKNFVARVPAAEAPEIAGFFVSHNGARYVASGHAIGQLLLDAEKIRTEWLTGRKITSADARYAESGDSLTNQMKRLGGDM